MTSTFLILLVFDCEFFLFLCFNFLLFIFTLPQLVMQKVFYMGEKPQNQWWLLLVPPQVCLGNCSPAHLFLSPVFPEKTTGHICKQQLSLERPAVAEDWVNT